MSSSSKEMAPAYRPRPSRFHCFPNACTSDLVSNKPDPPLLQSTPALRSAAELVLSQVRKAHEQNGDNDENHQRSAHGRNFRTGNGGQRANLKLPKLRPAVGKDAVDRRHSSA